MSDEKDYTLPACPFCGGEAKYLKFNRIGCKACGIRTVGRGPQFVARREWCRRVPQVSKEKTGIHKQVERDALNIACKDEAFKIYGEYLDVKTDGANHDLCLTEVIALGLTEVIAVDKIVEMVVDKILGAQNEN